MPQMSPMLWAGFPLVMMSLLLMISVIVMVEVSVNGGEDLRDENVIKMEW